MSTVRRLAAVAGVVAVLAVPAGLAAAGGTGGGTGGAQVGAEASTTIVLTAHHSRFTPSTVTVAPGSTVRFVVRNLDPIDHELIVGGPDVHRRHEVGREAHHHGDVPGEVSVPAGKTVSTTWTAPAAPSAAAGGEPVTYACHLPGHLAYGMSGTLEITAVATNVRTRS